MKVEGTGSVRTLALVDRELNRKTARAEAKDFGADASGGEPEIEEKALIEAIEKANKALVGPETMFKFSVHEGTKQIMVKVIDESTGEIVREIPPEKILDLVAKMWELAGIIVDAKV